ncbi:carbohydrate ABC transporter permease [Phytoactinopolyspora halophila]|uniref:carbohydrate ABC transporter permease n=1 Tax=Phytoactinopolyspora halophila TaxID=1981511 RepID=UPI0013140958|nr:sugar ABC transporter permease [Phytoactinopolyspora halophila]
MNQSRIPGRGGGPAVVSGPGPGEPAPSPPRPGRSWRRIFDDRIFPLLLIAPALLFIVGLVGFPVFRTAWLSFTDASGIRALTEGDMDFVGLANYAEIFSDPILRRSAITTVVFGLVCVVGTMVLGIAVALLLNQPFRGRTLLGVLVLLPWAIPHIAASFVWQWLFDGQYGVINWVFTSLGFAQFEDFSWFTEFYTAFAVVGIVVIWQSFPFVTIALLAGLQTIPADVIEASKLDGTNAWQRLRMITLPMLKPLLLVLVVISTIWDFKMFDQVWVLTGGGPARRTEVLSVSTYVEGITQSEWGMGAALAMVLFFILIAITIVYIKLIREEEQIS